jgi:hypothetical protein
MTDISNRDDLIDSRDVIEAIAHLSVEKENFPADWTPELERELVALMALQGEAEGYSDDWQCGAVLVRDSYFAVYARELLEDCGDIPRDLPSYIEIDWDATARNIRADYTSVDFDGVTYWVC